MISTAVSFFVNLLLWMSGSAGIILALMIYRRRENALILPYMVTLTLWSVNIGQLSVFVYLNEIAGFQNTTVNALLNDLGYAVMGGFVYSVMILAHGFFQRPVSIRLKWVFRGLAVLVGLPWLLPLVWWPSLESLAWLELVKVAALYAGLYYNAWFYYREMGRAQSDDVRKILKLAFWMQMIFYPLMLAEGALFYERVYPFVISPATLFFFAVNMLWLSHVSRYLHLPKLRLADTQPPLAVFQQLYAITPRECDVTALLLKGQSYQEIGEALFISKETVKTHVNSVYRKAGVQSKMALSNLIQQCGRS